MGKAAEAHKLGLRAVKSGNIKESLSFFKSALQVNPKIIEYWVSYIDALIKLERIQDAKNVLKQVRDKGAKREVLDELEQRINLLPLNPSPEQMQTLINLYNQGYHRQVIDQAEILLHQFPNAARLHELRGSVLVSLGQFDTAIDSYKYAIKIKPDFAEAYTNMGVALRKKGELDAAIDSYKHAISIKSDFAEAYSNMGNALKDKGNIGAAKTRYKQALKIKPDYAEAAFNLSGTSNDIFESKSWLEQCLKADKNHLKAKLHLAALRYYAGDRSNFNNLMRSSFKDHPAMRSFAWAFNLPKLPELYFHRWALFDRIVEQTKKGRPFYEFGVWHGEAFRYFMKTHKKGYGFDTFEGLPEDWHQEKQGKYSSDGKIPTVDGGEFIVGKFKDTLPKFFSKPRPLASLVNFDADLYSSTICALNFAKPVIDGHTILIFDEFIINKNWEHDEYKALNEFCYNNNYTYEVLAISFITKQVAVRLIGI